MIGLSPVGGSFFCAFKQKINSFLVDLLAKIILKKNAVTR